MRFKFKLRTLGMFVALVCVGLSWHTNLVLKQRHAVAKVRANGGSVGYASSMADSLLPRFAYDLLGVDFFCSVDSVSYWGIPSDSIDELKDLPSLRDLEITDNELSDLTPLKELPNLTKLWACLPNADDLSPLEGLTRLEYLEFLDPGATSLRPLGGLYSLRELKWTFVFKPIPDVQPISRLHRLEVLEISDSNLEDVSPLKTLKELRHLYLNNTNVRDVTALHSLNKLEFLNIAETRVNAEDCQRLKEALPNCVIVWFPPKDAK